MTIRRWILCSSIAVDEKYDWPGSQEVLGKRGDRWINRQQQQRIQYLQTEVAVLNEHIGKNRILLTNDQRR